MEFCDLLGDSSIAAMCGAAKTAYSLIGEREQRGGSISRPRASRVAAINQRG
jgi:hypothetical protein